jgi:hypothetical protein
VPCGGIFAIDVLTTVKLTSLWWQHTSFSDTGWPWARRSHLMSRGKARTRNSNTLCPSPASCLAPPNIPIVKASTMKTQTRQQVHHEKDHLPELFLYWKPCLIELQNEFTFKLPPSPLKLKIKLAKSVLPILLPFCWLLIILLNPFSWFRKQIHKAPNDSPSPWATSTLRQSWTRSTIQSGAWT